MLLVLDIYSDGFSSTRAVRSLFRYMHMNGILMMCLPLVTERLHFCLSRKMYVCIMTVF